MKENKNNWLWDELQAKNIKIEALKSLFENCLLYLSKTVPIFK